MRREDESGEQKTADEKIEERIDRNLEDSFPASDPPDWTLGIERRAEKKDNPDV